MDVKYGKPPVLLNQKAFHTLDYKVMGFAFEILKEMGNLWEEKYYRTEMAQQCRSNAIDAYEEVTLTLSLNGFMKSYYVDLLINGAIYELKPASCIADKHEAQTLNYLFLTNTRHGKILNFRTDSLTWRFVSTTLDASGRKYCSTVTSSWNPSSSQAKDVFGITMDLLSHWGAYLSTHLYQEALCCFLSLPPGNEHERFVPLADSVVLHISSLTARKNNLKNNLQKYLNRSRFTELCWINFNQNNIEFTTLNNHSAQNHSA